MSMLAQRVQEGALPGWRFKKMRAYAFAFLDLFLYKIQRYSKRMGLSKIFSKSVAITDEPEQEEPASHACSCSHVPARPEFLLQQQQQQQQMQQQEANVTPGQVVDRRMARTADASNVTKNTAFPKWVFCYYTSWSIYARNFPASSIPIEKMTHLLYGNGTSNLTGMI